MKFFVNKGFRFQEIKRRFKPGYLDEEIDIYAERVEFIEESFNRYIHLAELNDGKDPMDETQILRFQEKYVKVADKLRKDISLEENNIKFVRYCITSTEFTEKAILMMDNLNIEGYTINDDIIIKITNRLRLM